MPVRVITPPPAIVSTSDAKSHLRVDTSDDNEYIDTLVAAATNWIDGPAGWLGRALGRQTLEWIGDRFSDGCNGWIELPFPPVVSVTSVTYVAPDGTSTVMPSDAYEMSMCMARPVLGTSWPATQRRPDAVRIQYLAGYDTGMVPMAIRTAIKMLVAQWYFNRQPVAIGATVETMPFAVEALLSPFRVYG